MINQTLVAYSNGKVLLSSERPSCVYISGPMTGLPNYNFDAFNNPQGTWWFG